MKTELKAKFLQHLAAKKSDNAGFTLIELLVVIIIIGILSAIALPSFLNQANKARQSEAKTYVGSMNRAQQAFYLENNDFVTNTATFGDLGLGIASETTNYKYSVSGGDTSVSNIASLVDGTEASIKAYVGGVSVSTTTATGEASTLAVLCEGNKAGINQGPLGAATDVTFSATNAPECATAYKEL
ncbi:MAG: prepilin-type N-terminal cleavage/methylation domain-containing protein [Synechococcales cyanobacterium RM1_1_8]|nr:prepilin-type N-terminal cleavage/methylation domain-containing protein [Synechococcales cyanobacterium RM1_1_8]